MKALKKFLEIQKSNPSQQEMAFKKYIRQLWEEIVHMATNLL
jgi:hypothetical protein